VSGKADFGFHLFRNSCYGSDGFAPLINGKKNQKMAWGNLRLRKIRDCDRGSARAGYWKAVANDRGGG
jgi:hypothetical protein